MNKVNALKLRQSLGSVLKQLEEGGEPIFVERNNRPVAVLVSMREFSERFADRRAMLERERLVEEIHQFRNAQSPSPALDSLSHLRDLRRSR